MTCLCLYCHYDLTIRVYHNISFENFYIIKRLINYSKTDSVVPVYFTELVTLKLIDTVAQKINNTSMLISILVDLSKTFDTHQKIMLYKMSQYGVTGVKLDI